MTSKLYGSVIIVCVDFFTFLLLSEFMERWFYYYLHAQMFSRPLLVISIATAFSEQPETNDGFSDSASDSSTCSEVHSEESSVQTALDTR